MTLIEIADPRNAVLPQCAGQHTELGRATASAVVLSAHHVNDPGTSDLLHPTDNLRQHQHHRLLIEAAKEMEIDWPGFFDWKLSVIVRDVGLAVFLVAALVSLSIRLWGRAWLHSQHGLVPGAHLGLYLKRPEMR